MIDKPDAKQCSADRSKRYRALHPDRPRRPDARTGNRVRSSVRRVDLPFLGCDGEGGGTDEKGRQNFLLLRIGDEELYTGNHLSTVDCLDFICNASKRHILVGFYFNYDTTMILRDLPPDRLNHLFNPWTDEKEGVARRMQWTWFKGFGIKYLPRQYLQVCRIQPNGTKFPIVIKGSQRTIYETGGFFQGKFITQLENFGIGTEAERALIRRLKDDRSDFKEMTDEIRFYNHLECRLLSDLMQHFRSNCYAADIHPRTWNGAGKLAAALHTSHQTLKKKEVWQVVSREMMRMAGDAYYGGRFEVTRFGRIEGPIYEYDIASAYPDAMRGLPCLAHGRWEPFNGVPPDGGLYCATVRFDHGKNRFLHGLPIRQKKGAIVWPSQGNGTYWSCEIESAKRLGANIVFSHGFVYQRTCDCNLFGWVKSLYDYRKFIGKAGQGYPIKLGINSLYGLLAQRIGTPRFGNFLWAGLITARTRTKLNEAIALSPYDICMIATDGIYSKVPLDLKIGDNLGDWECQTHDGLFIVKPGLWWTGSKTKTRGIAKKAVEPRMDAFAGAWDRFCHTPALAQLGSLAAPVVPVQTTLFTGLKLANARGKPDTAGIWSSCERNISFDWSDKRMVVPLRFEGGCAVTAPYPGGKNVWTVTYAPDLEAVVQSDISRDELDAMPDAIDTTDLVLGVTV